MSPYTMLTRMSFAELKTRWQGLWTGSDPAAYTQLPALVLQYMGQDETSGMEPGSQGGLPALIQDLGLGSPFGDDPISTEPGSGGEPSFTAQGVGTMGSVGASLTQTPQVEKGLYVAGWTIWG